MYCVCDCRPGALWDKVNKACGDISLIADMLCVCPVLCNGELSCMHFNTADQTPALNMTSSIRYTCQLKSHETSKNHSCFQLVLEACLIVFS